MALSIITNKDTVVLKCLLGLMEPPLNFAKSKLAPLLSPQATGATCFYSS